MLSIDNRGDGLPEVVIAGSGVAIYLDNWAIIELANGDAKRRRRFVEALKSCGYLLFSFTNAIELGDADGMPAERIRTFLDEIGAHWAPIEMNPWTVAKRESVGSNKSTPRVSKVFVDAYLKERLHEASPEGSKVVDLSPDSFFKLSSVMKWASAQKDDARKDCAKLDEALIKRVREDYADYQRDPAALDKSTPEVEFSENAPARFALLNLLRLLVKESKNSTLKKGDGRDLCHAVLGSAYGSIAALDKHWKRRVEALPKPNNLACIYYAPQLDELVNNLEELAATLAKGQQS
jgi:hypothetical protein